jgi:hypothetical protein
MLFMASRVLRVRARLRRCDHERIHVPRPHASSRSLRSWRAIAVIASLLTGLVVSSVSADTKRWSKLQTTGTAPSERSRPAVASVGDKIFVFGGGFDEFASGEFVFYDDLFVLDTRRQRWSELSVAGARPAARAFAGHAGLESQSGFVVFGGGQFASDLSVTSYGDLWLFAAREQRWTRLADDTSGPGKRFDPKLWSRGNKIYAFGGLTETYEVANDLWSFDLRTRRWTLLTANAAVGSPPARGVARGPDLAYQGKLYFYGGEGGPDTDYKIFEDTWAFDTEAGVWQELTPAAPNQLDPARNHNSVARIQGALYAYGGDISGGPQSCGAPFPQNPVAELWRFDLRRARWEKLTNPAGQAPPPLKRHESAVVGSTMYLLSGYDFAAVGGGEACQVWNLAVYAYH